MEYSIKYKDSDVLIRKVKLISVDDKKYLKYKKDSIEWKKRKYPQKKEKDIDNKNIVDISFSFENILRKWMGSSNNRILCWEEFDGCEWKKQYMEMDSIIELGNNNIIVCEIKTQIINNYTYKNNIVSQLKRRRSILNCIPDLKCEFLGIVVLVDKSDSYLSKSGIRMNTELQEFDDNFSENEKIVEIVEDLEIKRIKLPADKLIDYGIRKGIIENDDLLNKIYLWIENNK